MTHLYFLGAILLALGFSALSYFCLLLAKREKEIPWGYWLASIMLGVYALGMLIGAARFILVY